MRRFLPLVMLLVSGPCMYLNAQIKTNRSVLEKASSDAAIQEQKDFQRLKTLATQKNWPMLTKGKNGAVSRLIGVDPAGYPLYVSTYDNLQGAATVRTNLLWPGAATGLNLTGSSANMKGKIAIWDGGRVLGTHVELNGRVLQKDNPASLEDHSTHVAGIMINSGVNPNAKGMAFGAQQLLAYDYSNDEAEIAGEASNLLVSNHSYGFIAGWYYNSGESRWEFKGEAGTTEDYKFGYYDTEAQTWDSIAYNAPYYLMVSAGGNAREQNGPAVGAKYFRANAAGTIIDAGNRPEGISNNDGYDIVTSPGVAKNILTVGAIFPIPQGYTYPTDVVLTEFSSWGPTDDGRIKPDIVTDGVNLLSSVSSSNNSYAFLTGTSMAAPVASGSIFLLQEYYSKLHSGAFMRAATLKGLVIHTADEAGPDAGPDYKHGWGLLNMERAASVITSNNSDQLLREEVLNNGQTFTLPVVASGKGQLTATICWTDPKGAVNTTNRLNNPAKKLINDLDIRIISGSTTFQPYILDPVNRAAPAAAGDNTIDNVEKIVIPGAVPGQAYTITVKHKNTLERGSQAFSLLVSGVGGQAYCASGAATAGSTRIESLKLGSVTKALSAACAGYTNLTNETIDIQTAQTIPFEVKLNTCNGTNPNRIVKIFMDFNNNGTFDAGEMVAQSATLTGNATFTGNIVTPASLATGNKVMFRIVAVETSNQGDVLPCGTYALGQTVDMLTAIAAPSKNTGISSIINPESASCALDSQMVTVRIRNFGDVAQSNIPITAVIKDGTTTIATWNTVYPLSIPALGEKPFTFQAIYKAVAGKTYTISAKTNLAGDQNTANDEYVATVSVSSGSAAPSGTAEQCGPGQVVLTRTGTLTDDKAYWYTTPTGGTPIASGNTTSTSVIPQNRTYYVGLNDVGTKVGLPNKMAYPTGAYNEFTSNFVRFTATAPMLIESARLYIGNPGQVVVTLAELASETATGYSYYAIDSVKLDAFATTPTPAPGLVTTNNPADTGAVFLLNLVVPEAGDKYILILRCDNGATVYRSQGTTAFNYPFSIPETFSITGNSVTAPTDFKTYYYYFYDMKINLVNCPSPRTAVVAGNVSLPVITLNGTTLTSSATTGNQWYRNGAEISGATGQTYNPTFSGVYKTVVSGNTGCLLASNEINFVSTAVIDVSDNEISLSVAPNPNNGMFGLQFEFKTRENLEITMVNATGQKVYSNSISGFVGKFNKRIGKQGLPSGMYLLQIRHGKDLFVKKVMVSL